MKIYNKKGFIRGLSYLVIFLISLFCILFKDSSLKLLVLSTIIFLFSVTDLSRSVSKTSSLDDITEENDERDRFIIMKSSKKTMDIMIKLNFILTILFMILYGVTKNNILLGAFLVSSSYITINFLVILITNIYYEKHE